MKKLKYFSLLILAILLANACKDDEMPMTVVELDDTPYILNYGALTPPSLPADNALTVQGVHLGKMLFYEKMLSKDASQACADCHQQVDGFSDKRQFSIGVENLEGGRQAMPIFNMGWHTNEFFWDGRASSLREQALKPIQDPLEMNETLDNVIAKLSTTQMYRDQFTRAFGTEEVTEDRIALALEQFMLSIVSHQSKYDKWLAGEADLTESEERGRLLFETEYNPFFPEFSGADCAHCHGGDNFENDQYMNNGLDTDASITDIGREEVTNLPEDKAKFKVPTLRNIELTAPYMHDGRFATLEEVIDHYNEGTQTSSTVDPTIANTKDTGLFLDAQDKIDLINFLKTLTDPTLATNNDYKSPF